MHGWSSRLNGLGRESSRYHAKHNTRSNLETAVVRVSNENFMSLIRQAPFFVSLERQRPKDAAATYIEQALEAQNTGETVFHSPELLDGCAPHACRRQAWVF